MERKLASIQIIRDIRPIEGADMIELATVNNWNVVVGKDVGHKVGDTVIYCEVDSFLPIKPEFEFLRKSSYKMMGDQEGFRLRTIKLRGQVSQGLIIPLSVLPNDFFDSGEFPDHMLGLDVSGYLGIVKYDPPIPAELAGKVKGNFPSFIPKTDEERIQNLTNEYEPYKNSEHQFYVTEKLDGTSATYFMNNGEFGVCSRNLELLETEGNTFWKLARELHLDTKLSSLGFNVAIQGELIGEGIQGNPYKLKGHSIRVYNVFNIDTQTKLDMFDMVDMCYELNLLTVPFVWHDFSLRDTISEMIEFADDKSILNQQFDREGIVVRSYDQSISFKVISNKFLLKEK